MQDNALARELAGAASARERAAASSGAAAAELAPGTQIGAFTIRSVLGVGGMGVVYLAEQANPRRNVAIKVLRSDLGSPDILRRFEYESAALALLKHPAIAQVYQAGTVPVRGVPRAYMAMELVKGTRLDEFCRERGLSRAARLTLIADIADGIEHAHRRGVIHRDLKPANILVEDAVDAGSGGAGRPMPRVLDFGVAKFNQEGGEGEPRHERTEQGSFLGTFAFAAPEQVSGDSNAIDARADVYALGVMLYEQVVGRRPRDMGKSLAESVRAVASGVIIAPETFGVKVDDELRTVLMTALAAEPERRYATAAALAEDIRRYLDKRPLRARPDSTLYTMRKAVARHPIRTATTLGVAVLIVGALTVSGLSLHHARQAEQAKGLTLDTIMGALELVNEDEGDAPAISSVDAFILEAAGTVSRQLKDFPEEQAALLQRLARAGLSRESVPQAAGILEEVVRIRRARAHDEPLLLADALRDLGCARLKLEQFELACKHLGEALSIRESKLGKNDTRTIDARYWLGVANLAWRKVEVAEELLRAAADTQLIVAPDTEQLSEYYSGVSACVRVRGDFETALDFARRALAQQERVKGHDHKRVAIMLSNVIANLISLERYEEADPLLARALRIREERYGADSPRIADTLVQMAGLKLRRGDWGGTAEKVALLDEARGIAQRAVDMRRRVHPGDHETVAEALSILGQIQMRRGSAEACETLREAFAIRSRLPRKRDDDLGHSQSLLGECLRRSGQLKDAETHLRQGLERVRAAYPSSHPRVRDAMVRLRDWCSATSRADEAEAISRELGDGAAPRVP